MGRLILPQTLGAGVMRPAPGIWTHRPKILEPRREIRPRMRVTGRFRFAAVAGDGVTVRRETGWIKNLITDNGLNELATDNQPTTTCAVGTGNSAPANGNTALDALVASTTTELTSSRNTNASSPYEMTSTKTFRFAQGAAEGNLAEVGVGNGAADLFSRALIVDGGGSPTTFPVAADEFLDVTYQLIVYPPLVDDEDTITISGSGDHDTVLRPSGAGTDAWRLYTGGAFQATANDGPSNNGINAYDGAIGAITGSPSGSSDGGSNASDASYSNGNFFRDTTWSFGLADANFAGGIDAVLFDWGNSSPVSVSQRQNMTWQCGFSPAIVKDSGMTLALVFRLAWARTP